MDRIFVMNLGSTSFKFKLYCYDNKKSDVIATGELESIGAPLSRYTLLCKGEKEVVGEMPIPDHGAAFDCFFSLLQKDEILNSFEDLTAVAYKAVHGGHLSGTRYVDDELIAEMEQVLPLAPAHNSVYLSTIKTIRQRYPDLKQAVRFETSFHATIPEKRTTYGVPYEWKEDLRIRRFGFHGSSHQYISQAIARLEPSAKRVISCHLGGSSSICAILEGKSIATSMGATPQSGLFHNNRVGDFDSFCIPFIKEHYGYNDEEVFKILSSASGFLGISGVSNDYRLVKEAADLGNKRAKLAIDAFTDQIIGIIGSYVAYLGGIDALVFTGGIGCHASDLRKSVCDSLSYFGIVLDDNKNNSGTVEKISSDKSRVSIWSLKTDEESVVANCVYDLLNS